MFYEFVIVYIISKTIGARALVIGILMGDEMLLIWLTLSILTELLYRHLQWWAVFHIESFMSDNLLAMEIYSAKAFSFSMLFGNEL